MKIEVLSDKYLFLSKKDCKVLDAMLFVFLLEMKYFDNNSLFSDDGKSTKKKIFSDFKIIKTTINNQPIYNELIKSDPHRKYIYKSKDNKIHFKKGFKKVFYNIKETKLIQYLYKLKSIGFISFTHTSYDDELVINMETEMRNFVLRGSSFNKIYKYTLWGNFVKYVIPPMMFAVGFLTLMIKWTTKS